MSFHSCFLSILASLATLVFLDINTGLYIIISVSLSIKAEQSAYVIDLSSVPCLCAHRYCGKTADWIRMPFGVVSGVGLGMGVLDFGGDRRRGRGSLG